jgi:acetoin utilization deacetylase AcuC-like enzyme
MKIFYSELHNQHNPPFEGFNADGNIPALEVPERANRIISMLQQYPWAEILPPSQFGLQPILAVHSYPYIAYLKNAFRDWEPFSHVPGMAFIPGTYGIDYDIIQAGEISESAGFFLLDTTVAVNSQTFNSALEAVNCALSGAQAILMDRASFALCRPPGHHAGREICGGYCYLNNAAIAAQKLSQLGNVAILDIDYHAGNGTQEIFYDRADVFMISIHAHPEREYPYFAGYAHETGVAAGDGFHRNYPLPAGIDDTAYLEILDQALALINQYAPTSLVVSVGMDIYQEDPLGDFMITRRGIHEIGSHIAALCLPTLIVMEGGYHLPSLGDNLLLFLAPFANQKC